MSGMLTATCPCCNEDYSYSDIMDANLFGEVILFNVTSSISDSDEENEFTDDDYDDLVHSRANE